MSLYIYHRVFLCFSSKELFESVAKNGFRSGFDPTEEWPSGDNRTVDRSLRGCGYSFGVPKRASPQEKLATSLSLV